MLSWETYKTLSTEKILDRMRIGDNPHCGKHDFRNEWASETSTLGIILSNQEIFMSSLAD